MKEQAVKTKIGKWLAVNGTHRLLPPNMTKREERAWLRAERKRKVQELKRKRRDEVTE